MTRSERHQELLKLWQDRHLRNRVVSLFHRALPDGQTPEAGMSMFDVILNHEYGAPPATSEGDAQAGR